uniref:Uncharacterized protein n=1 Tax=Mola mola TaxID=94237 RepID=A0A3Q3WVK3_MOLML
LHSWKFSGGTGREKPNVVQQNSTASPGSWIYCKHMQHLDALCFPPSVILMFNERLEGKQYCKCSQLLIEREERLFGGKKEAEPLKDHEEERAKLADEYRELEGHIRQTLKLSFSPESLRMEVLTSAVKAIVQEVEQDKRWKQRAEPLPAWRPNNWRSLHDRTLRSLVEQRMDEPLTPTCTQVKQSSVQTHINSMGRQLKLDLLSVVEVVKPCYPPGMDICNLYARLYHQSFGARLRKIAEFSLGDKDCTTMLCWVNEYYPGMVTTAEKVVGDRHKVQKITSQLKDLMERFKTFQNSITKQNRPNSRSFIKANLSCIEQFSDVLSKQSNLFSMDVRQDCLHILSDMRQSAHAYLLKPVHESLKVSFIRFQRRFSYCEHISWNTEFSLAVYTVLTCKLIGQLHQEVTLEYVTRLLKGELKLKDKAMQLKAYETVKDNAGSLHDLFTSMGSNEEWLKEILTKIAEVLKLQDVPAIQMHVASIATTFPDLSVRHVSALLKLKANFSRADRRNVKETLTMALSETSIDRTRPFFSSVPVK